MNPATDSMSDFSVTACGRMTTAAVADDEDDEMEVAEPPLEVDAVRALLPPPPSGESVADIMAPNEPVAGKFRYVRLRDA